MRKVRQRPARTLPVAILDVLLAGVAAVRALVRRVAGLLPARRGDRVVASVIVAAALVAVIGTGFLVVTLLRTPDQFAPLGVAPPPSAEIEVEPGDGTDTASGSATPPASSPLAPSPTPPRAGPRSRPERSGSPSPTPPPPLAARYATEDVTLLNYTASVTITNPGPAPASDWRLVITLPRTTQSVAAVDGAQASREGATWTFVPDRATSRVPARGSVQVRFRVDGALIDGEPTACTINNRPCEA
ncbi:cellulose binding domain-containing protein [Plantactinospora sp. ZYX-F-223]|uniref:cellulose binding domain-containing protein n=1 Tax=Plantactinospora sp. ZYX-F-223 TaxID=3144103 RepID=UPI0031FC6913